MIAAVYGFDQFIVIPSYISYQKQNRKMSSSLDSTASFPALCGLISFPTNSRSMLRFKQKLAPASLCVLADLLVSGAEIPRLEFRDDLPSCSRLSEAIRTGGAVRSITLGHVHHSNILVPVLVQIVSAAMNPAIEDLAIRGVTLLPEDVAELSEGLMKCAGLRSIEFAYGGIRDPTALLNGIVELRSLESIRISYIPLCEEAGETLALGLGRLPELREVRLENTMIGPRTARAIAGIPQLGRLRAISLEFNEHLLDEGVSALVEGFARFSSVGLERLNLARTGMGIDEGVRLAALVLRAPRLRSLDLSYNTISAKAAEALGKAIKAGCPDTIAELGVERCAMGSDGIVALLGPLRGVCKALSILKVSGNAAGDSGAKLVSECLGSTTTELALLENGITSLGARYLSRAFPRAYCVHTLCLANNNLSPFGASALLDSLSSPHACSMKMLILRGCRIADLGALATAGLILNRGCEWVDLARNSITSKGMIAIADSVSLSGRTQRLFVQENPDAGDKAAKLLAEKVIVKLVILEMKNIGMGYKAALAVSGAVREGSSKIKRLSVSTENCGAEGRDVLEELQKWLFAGGRSTLLTIH